MQELYYEETATILNEAKAARKYNIFKIITRICYIICIFYAIIELLFFVPNQSNVILSVISTFIPVAIFLVAGILLGKYRNTLYVEYDYTFVSGSIRVSKVIKNTKRYFVIKFDTYNIEKIGRYNSNTYKKYELMPGIDKKVLTQNLTPVDNKDFYYIVVNAGGQKSLLVFECTEQFIAYVLKFSNRTVLEERFFNK